MWPLALTRGAEARMGGGGGGFCKPRWESGGFHRTLFRLPWDPFSPFLFLLVLNGKEDGRGEEVG